MSRQKETGREHKKQLETVDEGMATIYTTAATAAIVDISSGK